MEKLREDEENNLIQVADNLKNSKKQIPNSNFDVF